MPNDTHTPTPKCDATRKLWKTQIRTEEEIWDFAREFERQHADLVAALEQARNFIEGKHIDSLPPIPPRRTHGSRLGSLADT
jgi:hypothetical protein